MRGSAGATILTDSLHVLLSPSGWTGLGADSERNNYDLEGSGCLIRLGESCNLDGTYSQERPRETVSLAGATLAVLTDEDHFMCCSC
eukprot:3936631-Rhodomonas_salina.1